MLSKPYNKPYKESKKNSKIKKNNFYKIIHKLVSLPKHPEILTEILNNLIKINLILTKNRKKKELLIILFIFRKKNKKNILTNTKIMKTIIKLKGNLKSKNINKILKKRINNKIKNFCKLIQYFMTKFYLTKIPIKQSFIKIRLQLNLVDLLLLLLHMKK